MQPDGFSENGILWRVHMYAPIIYNMNRLNDKAFKGIILLVAIIIIMAALVRIMNSSETLSEYAAKHPEQQVSYDVNPEAGD